MEPPRTVTLPIRVSRTFSIEHLIFVFCFRMYTRIIQEAFCLPAGHWSRPCRVRSRTTSATAREACSPTFPGWKRTALPRSRACCRSPSSTCRATVPVRRSPPLPWGPWWRNWPSCASYRETLPGREKIAHIASQVTRTDQGYRWKGYVVYSGYLLKLKKTSAVSSKIEREPHLCKLCVWYYCTIVPIWERSGCLGTQRRSVKRSRFYKIFLAVCVGEKQWNLGWFWIRGGIHTSVFKSGFTPHKIRLKCFWRNDETNNFRAGAYLSNSKSTQA